MAVPAGVTRRSPGLAARRFQGPANLQKRRVEQVLHRPAHETELKEMHKQFLTYLIMHEMGHTMGLMHNMKASQMLSPAEVNNKEITRKFGTMASVMDYPSINVALDKTKQGDYYTCLLDTSRGV